MNRTPTRNPAARTEGSIDLPEILAWGIPFLLVLDYLGLPSEFAALRVTRIATLAAYGMFLVVMLNGGLRVAVPSRQGRLLLGLLGMAAASLLYGVVKSYVPPVLRSQLDYFVLFVLSATVMINRQRVMRLAVVGTIIVLILTVRNADLLTSGIRVGTFRAGTFMGDGNDFAWGIIALMPLPLFLMLGKNNVIVRLFGLLGVCSAAFAVVGTQSRGATLAVASAGLYYWLVLSRRRIAGLVTIAALTALAMTFAPQSYFSRIAETDVETDSSAQGRLRAWGAAYQMALDYPLGVGVGSFNSAYGRYYMPEEDDVFSSRRWISAHSIYFKVLGESGFLGFILLIAVLVTNFRDNGRCLRFAREHPESSAIEDRWPALLNFGLIGYGVAGAFLGGLAYPHLYFLSGLTVACRQMTVDRPVQMPAPAPAPALVRRHAASVALLGPRAKAPQPPGPALPVRQPRFASKAPRA